ncbi:hypothetical protein JOE57_001174 [Microlunatus panaciterrae]|uniref:Uncharacterized protein n=1 Tax=Microlunatus panaciterrae TaxID=400768 RepID=A0ABS2RGX7_9ACTN|nr:hypothetical protein [Microlunatus panaciterrae]
MTAAKFTARKRPLLIPIDAATWMYAMGYRKP